MQTMNTKESTIGMKYSADHVYCLVQYYSVPSGGSGSGSYALSVATQSPHVDCY